MFKFVFSLIIVHLVFSSFSHAASDEYELYIGVTKRSIASAENFRNSAQSNLVSEDKQAAQNDCKRSLEYINEAQKSLDRFFTLPPSLVITNRNREVFKADYRSSYSNLVEKHKSLKDSVQKSCSRILASEAESTEATK